MDIKTIETVLLEQKEEFLANLNEEWCSRPEEELVEEVNPKEEEVRKIEYNIIFNTIIFNNINNIRIYMKYTS